MKKFIVSLVISAPLLLSAPSFAVSSSLYNPELRTDSLYSTNFNTLPKAGASYAYWHRGYHRWHRGYHRWHRWHHWNRWHYHYRW